MRILVEWLDAVELNAEVWVDDAADLALNDQHPLAKKADADGGVEEFGLDSVLQEQPLMFLHYFVWLAPH